MSLCAPWEPAYGEEICIPCGDDYTLDPVLYTTFLEVASANLYAHSGKQFPGVCEATIRPCSQSAMHRWAYSSTPTFASQTARAMGGFLAVCSCYSYDNCTCERVPVIKLPHHPIVSVDEVVTEDGTLDPDAYELRGGTLARLDGEQWPCCDEEFTVTYSYGRDPDLGGKIAAATLACELYRLCRPDDFNDGLSCRLPRNIASLSRQGVQVLFERLTQGHGPKKYGIPEIDDWLEAVNPHGVTARSVIMSPDTMPVARRVLG